MSTKATRQTSIDSWHELQADGKLGELQQTILDAFKRFGEHTDLELAKLLGFQDPYRVRRRRYELVGLGLIEEKMRRICSVSGRKAIVWGVVEGER